MKINKILTFLVIIFSFSIIISFENVYAEKTIDIEIKYTNGDRADYNSMKIIVYQDFDKAYFLEKELIGNPDFILVPENHRYKIEVFANGMYADVGYIELEEVDKKIDIVIPLSSGLQFEVYYEDGNTPIKDATVVLKSQDNSEWARGITNDQGKTTRYWIQSTTLQDDHYIADVYLEDLFLKSHYPIKLVPGISVDQKIITTIPEIVDNLISINLYDGARKITSNDGNYEVTLIDLNKNNIVTSNVNFRGDVQFSNIKSGTYTVKITTNDEKENPLWPQTKIHIIGDLDKFNIFKNSPSVVNEISPFLSCNCISFRLDDVQDYWLADTQVAIIDLFMEKNIPLTVGVIGSLIGDDERIIKILNENNDENNIEIANHSWNNDVLEGLDEEIQEEFIINTNENILEIFGVTPTTFIPPENKFDEKTISVLKRNGFTHLSAHVDESIVIMNDKNLFYQVPSVTETAILMKPNFEWELQDNNKIKGEIIQSITENGYAVIMMHPQEFSLNELGEYDIPNQESLNNLSSLLDDVKSMDLELITLNKIHPLQDLENDTKVVTDEKISDESDVEDKTDTCNCVAFRLNDVQDYWLNQVQMDVMGIFIENQTPLTLGIIADAFGNDQRISEYVKQNVKNQPSYFEIASKGIGLTPYTEFDKNKQNENLKNSLDLIESSTSIRPQVFIPPQNKFNQDTLDILQDNNITHISASLINGDSPPFEFKDADFFRFPQTTSTGKYIESTNLYQGVSSQQTIEESLQSIDNFGFAVISIQAQEFSKIENSTYGNTVDEKQIKELEKIITEFNERGIKIVKIVDINSNLIIDVPEWIKNNAGWWAEGAIDDKTFVQGIEYLVKENIIKVSEQSAGTNNEQTVPLWIKNNAGWWAEGAIDDKTFVQGIEYLVKNGIISY